MKFYRPILLLLMLPLLAQAEAPKKGNLQKTTCQFSYSPVYQFNTHFEKGGQFHVERHLLRLNFSRSISRRWMAGLGISFDYEHWAFSDMEELAGIELWDDIFRPGLSLPVFYRASNNWQFAAIPSFDFSGATGAEISTSFSYGTIVSASYVFNPELSVGLGGGVFSHLDQFKFFPYFIIKWQISDHLELTNPFTAGPAGPAGLELIYRPYKYLEISIGGAYRSYRFRLDDSSTISNGIGQMAFYATFVRVGFPLNRKLFLDINSGAFYGGEMTIDNQNYHEIGNADIDPAFFLSVTIKGRL